MRNLLSRPVTHGVRAFRSVLELLAMLSVLAACRDVVVDSPCVDAGEEAARRGEHHLLLWPEPPWFVGHQVGVGDTLRFEAEVAPVTGADVDISTGGCRYFYGPSVATPITWASSDTTIARATPAGLVIGRALGDVLISVRASSPWLLRVDVAVEVIP
jgi:hypothetical protein